MVSLVTPLAVAPPLSPAYLLMHGAAYSEYGTWRTPGLHATPATVVPVPACTGPGAAAPAFGPAAAAPGLAAAPPAALAVPPAAPAATFEDPAVLVSAGPAVAGPAVAPL